jgi:hypothetical protein
VAHASVVRPLRRVGERRPARPEARPGERSAEEVDGDREAVALRAAGRELAAEPRDLRVAGDVLLRIGRRTAAGLPEPAVRDRLSRSGRGFDPAGAATLTGFVPRRRVLPPRGGTTPCVPQFVAAIATKPRSLARWA